MKKCNFCLAFAVLMSVSFLDKTWASEIDISDLCVVTTSNDLYEYLKNDKIKKVGLKHIESIDKNFTMPKHIGYFDGGGVVVNGKFTVDFGFTMKDFLYLKDLRFVNDVEALAVARFDNCVFENCHFKLTKHMCTRRNQRGVDIVKCSGNRLEFELPEEKEYDKYLKVDTETIKNTRDISYIHPWLKEHSKDNEYNEFPFAMYASNFNYYFNKVKDVSKSIGKGANIVSLVEKIEQNNELFNEYLSKIDYKDSEFKKESLQNVLDELLSTHFDLFMSVNNLGCKGDAVISEEAFSEWASAELAQLIPNVAIRNQVIRTAFFSKTKCGMLSIASPNVYWDSKIDTRKYFEKPNLAKNVVWFDEKQNDFLEWRNAVIRCENKLKEVSKNINKLLTPKEVSKFKKTISDFTSLRKSMESILQIVYFDIPIQYFLSSAYLKVDTIILSDNRIWRKNDIFPDRGPKEENIMKITNIVRDVAPIYKMTKVCKLYSTNDIRTSFIAQLKDYLKMEEYEKLTTTLSTDPDWMRDKENLKDFFNRFTDD